MLAIRVIQTMKQLQGDKDRGSKRKADDIQGGN